jgi:hypothetical protein
MELDMKSLNKALRVRFHDGEAVSIVPVDGGA